MVCSRFHRYLTFKIKILEIHNLVKYQVSFGSPINQHLNVYFVKCGIVLSIESEHLVNNILLLFKSIDNTWVSVSRQTACHAGGREFESRRSRHLDLKWLSEKCHNIRVASFF